MKKYKRNRNGSGGARAPGAGGGVLRDTGGARPSHPKRGVTFGQRPAKQKPRFRYGASERVDPGVRKRTQKRLKALGHEVSGVNLKDGITGREARRVKRAYRKAGRPDLPGQRPGKRPGSPGAPGRSRTPVLDAMTELQYGGQERELDYQRAVAGQRLANTGDWYKQYQQQIHQTNALNAAYTQGLQQAQFNQANTVAAQDQQANAALLQQAQADAANRGTTVDPSLAQTMQAGVASRQAQGTQFGGLLAAHGQAQQGYLAGREMTAAGQGVQARMDEQRRAAKIDQLAQELQAEKGAFRVKTAFDLRQQRHDNRLEDAAAVLAGVKEAGDQENDRRDDRRAAREDRWDRRMDRAKNKLDRFKAKSDNWKTKHEFRLDYLADLSDDGQRNFSKVYSSGDTKAGGKGSGSGNGGSPKYTPSQRNSKQEEFRTARALARTIGGKPKAVLPFLINKKDIDPLVARAAVAPWTLTAGQRAELRRMGIKVKRPGPHETGARPAPLGPK